MKSEKHFLKSTEDSMPMELHFPRINGIADRAIDELMQLVGGIKCPDIVREIILTALKAGQENNGRADLKFMNSALKEMRFTSKVFGGYQAAKKVTVFGSARIPKGSSLYEMARELGRTLVQSGYMVITGGGPGIMQAVNEGAGAEHSFGINIRLPFEQRPNPVLDGNPRYILYKYFFTRKVAFLKEAHAAVLFPGGFGTLDETLETITLLQTGKQYPIPLILIERAKDTYWKNYLSFFEKELLGQGYISETDFDLFEIADSIKDAVEKINRFYFRYHSLRYVGEQLVIRLNSPITIDQVAQLKSEFHDLMVSGGKMVTSGPLKEEFDEPEIVHLPRLILDFSKENFGRLRKFIDVLNSF